MALDPKTLPPAQAWEPLNARAWNADHARHLLRRMGFAAMPDQVARSLQVGLAETLRNALGNIRPYTAPAAMTDFVKERAQLVQTAVAARMAGNTDQTKVAQMEVQRLQRAALTDSVEQWLTFARQPENSAQENLVLFLSNVVVVASSKVEDPARLFAHLDLIRNSWRKPYPDFMKAITLSPAMIQYLDLNTSVKGVPNENYAREVMELFTLGEGHYSETDIKEGARSFTGIVIGPNEEGLFRPNRWDPGLKTMFGHSGPWKANDAIDLIFTQPAARTRLPHQFLAWYLSNDPLPDPYLDSLGDQWKAAGWGVDDLARMVFSSQLFYDPQFQGALIKNPIHYYLGLLQDLNLDVSPLEGQVYQSLTAMGMQPFNAPNVRGWLGGKNWINSSTLAARRQIVQQLFNPPDPARLNADQQNMIANAQSLGRGAIGVTNERLQNAVKMTGPDLADHLLSYFLAGPPNPAYRADIVDFMQNSPGVPVDKVKQVSIALLQSPLYHLC